MEYDINSFVSTLRELMYNKFPFEDEKINALKHPNRIGHIRDVAFKNNDTIYVDENTLIFDIGNPYAEERYPYYHILEDAPVIRKRGKGTEKSKGSQATVEVAGGKRDYGRIRFNGKTYSKEYRKNVRGERAKVIQNATRHLYVGGKQQPVMVHSGSNYYENIHYQYIENMLNGGILDELAATYGLQRKRTESTGLGEEYQMQEHGLLGIISSFN